MYVLYTILEWPAEDVLKPHAVVESAINAEQRVKAASTYKEPNVVIVARRAIHVKYSHYFRSVVLPYMQLIYIDRYLKKPFRKNAIVVYIIMWIPKYKVGDILDWQSKSHTNIPVLKNLKIIQVCIDVDKSGGTYVFEYGSMWGPTIDEEATLSVD
jgi:hypothetical protein